MRVLELFAGYGSQALALENLGIEFTSDISEIDKYAIQAYNQLHGDTHNWGDITKIDETKLPYYDLITYSSPCQDFSVAGLQKGGDAGSGTRSSLLWECERIIRAVKPKYLLMENVKNLVGKKHIHNFISWLQVLEMMGYQNYWQVLNAKDYGVPQNRERVFVVSILGCGQYLFPNPVKLEKRLKDILEPVVDEKYYLKCDSLIEKLKDKQYLNTIRCGGGSTDTKHSWDIVCVASRGRENGQELEVNETGCSNALTSVQKDNYLLEPNVLTPKRTEYGKQIRKEYESGIVKVSRHNMTELEPRQDGISNTLTSVQKDNLVAEPSIIEEPYNLYPNSGNPQAGRVYNPNGISPAMDTCSGGNRMPKITESYRIRKLTPRECWRLMGVKDEQFDKLHGISNSQLYKLAGNSIVVDVLMGIFKNLFLKNESTGQLSLFGGAQ
jgi:DNA (cytosine-5)-methyltransferase 1